MTDQIRAHIVKLLDWEEAHVDFDTAVAGMPIELRGRRVPGFPHSAWELLEHLRLAQRDLLDFCRDAHYKAPKWPDDYWPSSATPPDDASWNWSVKAFNADRNELKAFVADASLDLTAKIPHGTGQTYLRSILLVADHNAYHVGQLVAVRQQLGAWKS
jgi:uncharacterized damage-inducible protein DinB